MIVNVELWAFREGEVREVEVPDVFMNVPVPKEHEKLLEEVFYWGQNEHQPKDQPSVSMGDVAVLPNGERWFCEGVGWSKLNDKEYEDYKSMDRQERVFYALNY